MRKFKCIKSYESGIFLTNGKIYTEDSGKFRYDDGWVSHGFDYNISHFGTGDIMSNYLEEVFDEEIKEDKKVNKFKVGDMVKIICNSCGHCFNIGDIVELYEDCGGNFRGRTSKNEYKANHILEDDMEKFIEPTESSTTFTITTSDTTTTLTDGTHTTSINRYYTDKHDDMVALEEVVKKYKSEIDEINKDKEIKEAIDKFIKDNNYDVEVEVKGKVIK